MLIERESEIFFILTAEVFLEAVATIRLIARF